ncbi:MAG: hypothetical protein WCO78_02565 [Candidatus Roizmanbacteria bacterium]
MDLSQKKIGVVMVILGIFGVILLCMNLVATVFMRKDAQSTLGTGMYMMRNDFIVTDLKIVENTPRVAQNKNPFLLEKEQQKEFLLKGVYLYDFGGTTSAHLDKQEERLETLAPIAIRAWSTNPAVTVGICAKDRSTCDRSYIQRISGQVIPVTFALRGGQVLIDFPSESKQTDITGLFEAEAVPVIFN